MVRTGLDILISEKVDELKGRKIGILANHTSLTSDFVHISDALISAGLNVKVMFAPEHGIRGDIGAGETVTDCIDKRSGVLVRSLYGQHGKADVDLSDVDVMLVDIQDVGARFYTHIAIIKKIMAACAKSGVPVYVLDRPNPITGLNPEGPMLESGCESLVGINGIPIRHSLTVGEIAKLISSKLEPECNLNVIRMENWSRNMWYDFTGIAWVMPSPNIPTIDTAIVYPGTCLLEGTNLSEGRGTTKPFELFGAPWIDTQQLHDKLMSYKLPAVAFREAYFSPSYSKFKEKNCAGLQIHVLDRGGYKPVLTGIAVVCAVFELYPDNFAFIEPKNGSKYFFDLLSGGSRIRQMIQEKNTPFQIAASWKDNLDDYTGAIKEFFIYK